MFSEPSNAQKCAALDIRWYSWLDGTRIPTKLNVSRCGPCQEQMLRFLDEVNQDISYANKTLDIDRILQKLNRRLSDIQGVFGEHATGYGQSSEALQHSVNAFAAHYDTFSVGDLNNATRRIIERLESETNNSRDYVDRVEHVKLEASLIELGLDRLLTGHVNYLRTISQTKDLLNNISRNFDPQTNHSHTDHPFGRLIEHSANQLEFIADQSNRTLLGQAKKGILIDEIYSNHVIRLHQLTNISRELQGHLDDRAARLVLEKMSNCARVRHIADKHLEVSLKRELERFEKRLENARETLSHLSDLKQSVHSNDEREADERIVLAESFKDIRNLSTWLDKLTQRLRSADAQKAQLEKQLEKLQSLDQTTLATVANLTSELAQKNSNMSRWHSEELGTLQSKLTLGYEQILRKFRDDTSALNVWSDTVELTRRVDAIISHVHAMNATINSINKTMNSHVLLAAAAAAAASVAPSRLEKWHSRDLISSLLNITAGVRSAILLAHDSQLNQLRQLVLLATTDLDQTRMHLNEVHAFKGILDSIRSSHETLTSSHPEKLSAVIEESSKINAHISGNLTGRAENVFEKFTLVAGRLAHQGVPSSGNSSSRVLEGLADEIRISGERFETLKDRITRGINATRISEQTQFAHVEMRASLKSLRDKVMRARSLIIQKKEVASNITNADTSKIPPIGQELNLPLGLVKHPYSSRTSISFLIRTKQNETDEIILLVEGGARTGESSDNCSAQSIFIGIRQGRLALEIQLGLNASTAILDDEKLLVGRVYRVAIIKIGLILNVSIKSEHSASSTTRSLNGPFITFNLDPRTSRIYYGGFPANEPGGACNTSSMYPNIGPLSGQLDKLRLNDYELGLGNAVAERQSVSSGVSYGERACEPLSMEMNDSQGNNTGRLNEHTVRLGRLASFSKPKSNISSSFVQVLHSDSELDELLVESSCAEQPRDHLSSIDKFDSHIREMTISFRTSQTNGLILHHARPDHSSFLSIYISGGRLMFAFNFDKKIRFESHFTLSDGNWHHLNMALQHGPTVANKSGQVNGILQSANNLIPHEVTSETSHRLVIILDDMHLYQEDFNLTTTQAAPKTPDPSRATVAAAAAAAAIDNGNHIGQPQRKLLYFGGLEDKYSPLLRSQQIPINFQGCLADVTINRIWINLANTSKSSGISLGHCEMD